MNAVDFIKDRVDFLDLLNHYGARQINSVGDYIRCCCPIHGGDNPTAFVYNKNTKLWYCHTGCDTGGSLFDFVMLIEDISFVESIAKIAEIFNIDISNMEIAERASQTQREIKQWLEYMRRKKKQKVNRPFDLAELEYTDLKQVTSFRHFTGETLEKYQCLLADQIKVRRDEKVYTLKNRLIVPIYQEGILIGATCRKTKSEDFGAKWTTLPVNIETGIALYNYDSIIKGKPVIVVEGPFDVWNMEQLGFENVVASFGSHLTTDQIKLLQKVTLDLILCYDPDKAGLKATERVLPEVKNKFNTSIMLLPNQKDPGELSEDEISQIRKIKPHEFKEELKRVIS